MLLIGATRSSCCTHSLVAAPALRQCGTMLDARGVVRPGLSQLLISRLIMSYIQQLVLCAWHSVPMGALVAKLCAAQSIVVPAWT